MMILTQDYSRVAAGAFMDAQKALRLLGIERTDSFAGDRQLVLGMIKRYHSDLNPSEEAKEKIIAANSLWSQFIQNKERLPERTAPRPEPARPRQPTRAPEERPAHSHVADMFSQVRRGFDLVDELARYCTSWIALNDDCRSIKETLRNGLFKEFEKVMHAVNTRPNRDVHLGFVRFLDGFESVYSGLHNVVTYCHNNNRHDLQLSDYLFSLKWSIDELRVYKGLFDQSYERYNFRNQGHPGSYRR